MTNKAKLIKTELERRGVYDEYMARHKEIIFVYGADKKEMRQALNGLIHGLLGLEPYPDSLLDLRTLNNI
jgi:hypothetical protein